MIRWHNSVGVCKLTDIITRLLLCISNLDEESRECDIYDQSQKIV